MVQTSPARPSVVWVDDTICNRCDNCDAKRACRTKVILQIDPGEPPFVDVHRCMGCMDCVSACPMGAIKIVTNGGAIT
jgi:Fe-S-cluster-containing hydrogenase component 2